MASELKNRPLCRYYNTSKGCRKAANCKFAHEKHSNPAQTRRDDNNEIRQWIYQIPKSTAAKDLGGMLPTFIQTARRLIASDADTRQEVIMKLATEGGLLRLDEVCRRISVATSLPKVSQGTCFRTLVLPLLEILAYENVLSSMILETPRGIIINFIFGPNGRRTLSLFGFAAEHLLGHAQDISDEFNVLASYKASLSTLSQVVDLNGSALTLDSLRPIISKFHDGVELLRHHFEGEAFLQQIESYLKRIQRRIEPMNELDESADSPILHQKCPQFHLRSDAPGWLSEYGARHDNDFENFADINIMPTYSEFRNSRPEYLPSIDLFARHVAGVDGLLDRQFRLLREDRLGCVRDAIKHELDREHPSGQKSKASDQQHATRTLVYRNARIFDMKFHKHRGLDLVYGFDQPEGLDEMGAKGREKWWEKSRRMQHGAFICLLDTRGNVQFCSVSETGLASEASVPEKKRAPGYEWQNVYENEKTAFVTLSLIDTNEGEIERVLQRLMLDSGEEIQTILEFPGVLLASFRPVLEGLKRRQGEEDLPFANVIAPSTSDAAPTSIPPPLYAMRPGFRYDLSCLTGNHPLYLSPKEPFDCKELLKKSTLDEAQARAIVDALSRGLALIQGPPGTGKSYTGIALIKVLLKASADANLGPIICVTYTNHALDQALEALVEQGVDQIVRIGSQSKSEVLKDLNLRNISSRAQETRNEYKQRTQLNQKMDRLLKDMNDAVDRFARAHTSKSIQQHLTERHPHHAAELFEAESEDEDGFRVVRHSRLTDPVQRWLASKAPRSARENNSARPISTLEQCSLGEMSISERYALHAHWLHCQRQEMFDRLGTMTTEYLKTRDELRNARQEIDLRCLQQANVIGVTTSGLARITDLLGRLSSRIMVCEEAGEVLEAHIITALLPTIEHAILIGDHQQLRPQIQNYALQSDNPRGKQYSFDASLFERLVLPPCPDDGFPSVPFSALETQRRMHPSISRLIRSTIYPHVQDAANVYGYNEVAGFRKRLFWFDHNNLEAKPDADHSLSMSKSNDFEGDFITALISHLLRQGVYKKHQIAVLTPYLGQLRKLREKLGHVFAISIDERDIADMESQNIDGGVPEPSSDPRLVRRSLLQSIRIATVDNFQGEEAEVVIISLVRSNEEGSIGFLRTPNRINVLLTRAKHGMFIVGNARVASKVPMWSDVIDMLQQDGQIGQSLELCCPRHPDTIINVKTVDDFHHFSPEGGCQLKCAQRLPCGHSCVNKCHSESLHLAVRCLEPCQRPILGCDMHPCPQVCGEPCPKRCDVVMPDTLLRCGHIENVPCYQAKDLTKALCQRRIKVVQETCGHEIEIACHEQNRAISCNRLCDKLLPCGHRCKRLCSECLPGTSGSTIGEDHGPCTQQCGRSYTICSHYCSAECHGDQECPPCSSPCDVKCIHSACKKRCSEACSPCAEEHCASACPHSRCEMPCGVPCNWSPCSRRCQKLLECNHQCPSVCGEPCPSAQYCQECCSSDIRNMQVDFILGESYGDIDLHEDPCIFPDCGHVITMTNLDGIMDFESHYATDADESLSSSLSPSAPFSIVDVKRCPTCRGSLRNICRYGRIIKRALLDESTKRFCMEASRQYKSLAERCLEIENAIYDREKVCVLSEPLTLVGARQLQLHHISRLPVFSTMYKAPIALIRQADKFCRRVALEEQPYYKVINMVENFRKRHGSLSRDFKPSVTILRPEHSLRGQLLQFRLELALYSRAISLKRQELSRRNTSVTGQLKVNFDANRLECGQVAEDAKLHVLPKQQVASHILWARYAALELSVCSINHRDPTEDQKGETSMAGSEDDLRNRGLEHLELARELCSGSQIIDDSLSTELENTLKMLKDHFYEPITEQERRQVLEAMSQEFSGTGHWYNCVNGHPFTVGECGRPMEETKCPQCGAPVGGQHHQEADGVTRATDLENELANMRM